MRMKETTREESHSYAIMSTVRYEIQYVITQNIMFIFPKKYFPFYFQVYEAGETI